MYEKVGCEVHTFLGFFVLLLLSVECPLLLVCLLLGVRNFGWSREERKETTPKQFWFCGVVGAVDLWVCEIETSRW